MSLFTKAVKSPDPIKPIDQAQAQNQLDDERRNRAQKGGRAASFIWDAEPIAPTAPKPNLFGG